VVDETKVEETTASASEQTVADPPPRRRIVRLEHVRTVVLAVLLALSIRAGLAQAYLVEGPSMEPTLENGERVLVVKYPYGLTLPTADEALVNWSRPEIGDVVILSSPVDSTDLVKRVVGLAGDRVAILDGEVVVNGTPLATGVTGDCPPPAHEEGCIWTEERSGAVRWHTRRSPYSVPETHPPIVVPQGSVFVLGDHRDRSNDSRYFGPVTVSRLRGRVVFVD
jgi:signal peptidase I